MQVGKRMEFETEDQRRVYEHVERNGVVERRELVDALSMDAEQCDRALSALERDGQLEDRDGLLRIAIDVGTEMEYTIDGFEFTIRPARQTDLAEIVGIMRQVSEEESYFVAETVVDLLDNEDVVNRYNQLESRVFFVATVDDVIVGWVHLHSPNYAKLAHTAELTIGVLEGYRGHGIGDHLLERGLGWAASNGYEKVYQSLPATNQDAVTFLEKHRWETEAIRQAHYKIDDEYVAEQMMAVMIEGREP